MYAWNFTYKYVCMYLKYIYFRVRLIAVYPFLCVLWNALYVLQCKNQYLSYTYVHVISATKQ